MDRGASRSLARNPQLRRLLTAWTAFSTGNPASAVLVVVFAFSAGGAAAVGAATVLRVLPGGLLAPLTAGLATSSRPQVHLAIGIGARSVVMVATIVAVLTGASLAVVLALVAADSLVSAAVRPLHGALIVRLADTAAAAAAANSASGSLVNAATLAGPALAGLALGIVGIGWAFALPAAVFAAGTVAALLIRMPRADDEPPTPGNQASRGSVWSYMRAVGAGFRAIAESRPATAATVLFVLNVMLLGVWLVASAPVADDRLGLGKGGITTIMTVNGAGGLLGALATLFIAGRRGLPRVLAGAMVGWAVSLAAIGVTLVPAPGLALAAAGGAALAVAYAIAPTLVQRSVARDTMVPAVATLHSLSQVGIAAGSIIAVVLIGMFGVAAALAVMGAAAVVVTALAWPQLRKADALSDEDTAKLAVIRATPMLAPLPALALEQLARAATRLAMAAGSEVIRQGDRGHRFYMIAAGLADVTVDGRRVATLGPRGSFGEIALLHDVARSATVTAREDLDLVAVDRAEFFDALSSETGAVGRIGGVARARLATRPVEERLVELDCNTALRGQSVAQLLAAQPPLAAIGANALSELAQGVRVVAAPDGALITREGDYGEAYYVIVDGAALGPRASWGVFEDETPVRDLVPGEGFGEQSILRDVPRTATVRAVGDTTLVAVDREAFQRARQAG